MNWRDGDDEKTMALVLLALLVTPARAQSVMHQEININRISNGGVLAACSVVFDILYRDLVYRQGLPSLASGSLNFYLQPRGAFASVKVVGQDLSAAAEQLGFFQVTNAFVEVNGTAHQIDKQTQCDRPTGSRAVRPPLDGLSRREGTHGRSPGVSSVAFRAQSSDLRFAS
jgi:hypothetical protein